MSWIPLRTADGSWTLLHPGHGEGCHSRSGAWMEARERYAGACRLSTRRGAPAGVRVLDVGTGLGLNIAAALEAVGGDATPLHVCTFEEDREVLETAIALYGRLEVRTGPWTPYVDVVRRALVAALAQPAAPNEPVPLGRRGTLRLLLGDAREAIGSVERDPPFDAVFLDPFSPAVEPALWGEPFLRALAERMAPGSWLSTYTAAFAVRRGLARAGLRVGCGPRVGAKAEGTLASPDLLPPPLPDKLVRRLARELADSEG